MRNRKLTCYGLRSGPEGISLCAPHLDVQDAVGQETILWS